MWYRLHVMHCEPHLPILFLTKVFSFYFIPVFCEIIIHIYYLKPFRLTNGTIYQEDALRYTRVLLSLFRCIPPAFSSALLLNKIQRPIGPLTIQAYSTIVKQWARPYKFGESLHACHQRSMTSGHSLNEIALVPL